MSIDYSDSTRKSQVNQPTNGNGHDPTPYEFDKFQVLDKSRNWEVRLQHRWIKSWFRVLHPLAIQLWCTLKMHANWTKGEDYGKTGDWYTRSSLMHLTGTSPHSLTRGLKELHFYGLLKFEEPDPDARRRRGKCCRMVLVDDARVPSESVRLPHEKMATTRHKTSHEPWRVVLPMDKTLSHQESTVDASTAGQNGPTPLGHFGPTPLGQNGPTPLGQNGPTQYSSSRSSSSEQEVTSSSSLDLSWEEQTTTTRPAPTPETPKPTQPEPQVPKYGQLVGQNARVDSNKPGGQVPAIPPAAQVPDLTPLRTIDGLFLEDKVLRELWIRCRKVCRDVTVEEIGHCLAAKLPQARAPYVRNSVGFLLAAVPSALGGGWLTAYREAMAQQKRAFEAQAEIAAGIKEAWERYDRGEGPSPRSGQMKRPNGDALTS